MNEETALEFARRVWGKWAFANIHRKFMPDDYKNTDADGYVIASGPITSYTVGYRRKGKFGGHYLYTTKGRGEPDQGFVGAFEDALNDSMGTKAGDKLAGLIEEIREHV